MDIRTVKKSIQQERKEKIANGTWMPRGTVIPTGKQKAYKRNNLKKALRQEILAI